MFGLFQKKIKDENILWLLRQIIDSFESGNEDCRASLAMTNSRIGIPLGNLTSQVFANIYLNELDQFAKHWLKIKYYLRYADDFIIISDNKHIFDQLTSQLGNFLQNELKISLHPNKIIIRKLEWGIDFLGYINLPNYILPRTSTKRRILKNLESKTKEFYQGELGEFKLLQTFQSYFGYLSHANTFRLKNKARIEFLSIF